MSDHLTVLEEMFALAANERRMKEADACAAAIALMRGQSWQEIATAPKNEPVLVFLAGQQFTAWYQDDLSNPFHDECDPASDWNLMWVITDNRNGPYPLRGGKPTHWQPLPAPPKDSADE